METFGLMKWTINGHPITRQVQIIGIDPSERAKTGDFAEFLFADQDAVEAKPPVRMAPSFDDQREGQAEPRRWAGSSTRSPGTGRWTG